MIRSFRFTSPTGTVILPASDLLLLSFSYVLAAFLVLEADPWVVLLYDRGLLRILVAVLATLLGLHFFDVYTEVGARYRGGLAPAVSQALAIGQAVGLAFVVQAILSYASPAWMLPRRLMLGGSAFSLAALAGWRVICGAIASRTFGVQGVLFVGRNAVVEELAGYLESHPEAGLANLGYVDETHPVGQTLAGAPVRGPLASLREIVAAVKPHRIVVGMSERARELPIHQLLDLAFSGAQIEDAGLTYEILHRRISTKALRPSHLVFSGELEPRRELVALQSLYSLIIALAASVLAAPLMLLTAAAIKLTSRGPVLCRQTRVGRHGKHFVLYKFRCTYHGLGAGPQALPDGPRTTPLGRWLRRLRLEGLPQLFNVLRGEMSIVGPRPQRPECVRILSERIFCYPQRHCVKPGLTGWAQINRPAGDTVADSVTELEYDLYYIKHLSPGLDAYIILQALKTVLRWRGAQ